MERKARIPQIRNGGFYEEIGNQIMELETSIARIRTEIASYLREAGAFSKWAETKGIDYTADRVQGGHVRLSLSEALERIRDKDGKMARCLEQLGCLQNIKRELERLYQCGDGKENKVFYYRIIKKMTQEKAAEKVGISVRQLQRIEKKLKEK